MRIMMQHARRGHAQTASARVYGPPPSNRPVATLRPRIKARTSAAAALSPGHGLQSSSRPPRTADRRPRHHLHQSPTSAPNASLATTSTRGLGSSHGRRRGQTHDRARGDLVAATGEIHVTVDSTRAAAHLYPHELVLQGMTQLCAAAAAIQVWPDRVAVLRRSGCGVHHRT